MATAFADDADSTGLEHYVPLTEDFGTSCGDASPSGFDGTIAGTTSPEVWTGTPHGNSDLDGKVVPVLVGRARVCAARWVDATKLIFQVADRSVDAVRDVREGFVSLTEDTTTTGTIFRNPPTAGKWRWTVETVDGISQTYARLGSQPQGSITFTADAVPIDTIPATGYPAATAAGLIERVFPDASIEAGSLDTDAPYVVGDYYDEPTTLASALDSLLIGVGTRWTVDPRNPFSATGDPRIVLSQARDVSAETPVATYYLDPDDAVSDVAAEGLSVVGFAPHYRSVSVLWDHFRGHLTSADEPSIISIGPPIVLVPMVEIQNRIKEWRSVTRPRPGSDGSAEILELHAEAYDIEIESAIRLHADAASEADRQVTLNTGLLPIYRCELTGGVRERWIGDVVDIVGRRLLSTDGSEVTRRCLVVGVDESSERSGTVLELWGGFIV